MADLQSPGVDIRIIEEEISAGTGPGTVPLIFVATATNKTTEAGGVAEGTLAENAGKLELLTSQRELLQRYGIPSFRTVDGTVVQGDETNEYGLHAAYSYLGLANRAYVVRANLDTSQLLPSEQSPRGRVANGTYWLNSSTTSFGVFVANGNSIPGLSWDRASVLIPSASDYEADGSLKSSFGNNGDYAASKPFDNSSITIMQKLFGTWEEVGSTEWSSATPTIATSRFQSVVSDSSTVNLIINGNTVSIITGLDLTDVANAINTSNIDDITATVSGNNLVITNTVGGDIVLSSSGDALTQYGFNAFYPGVSIAIEPHTSVPSGATVGSIWVKTTEPNSGAKFDLRRYNIGLDQFTPVAAPVYEEDAIASAAFGNALTIGSVYVQITDGSIEFVLKRYNGTAWEVLSYEYADIEPTGNPDEGTLWFNAALEADIMVNTGNQWRGYRNVYPLTDPLGPTISSQIPTTQQGGAPLVNYDLWIKSDDRTGYPKLYRYLNGSWNLVDNTDRTTPFGVVFGDIRENTGPVGPWNTRPGSQNAQGVATLRVDEVSISNPGSGYTDGTYAVVVADGTSISIAELEVVVAGGEVVDVSILSSGEYSQLPPNGAVVKVLGIAGSPTVEAEFLVNWNISDIEVTSSGSGYDAVPAISIVGGNPLTPATVTAVLNAGTVDLVTIIDGGSGYNSVPSILFDAPQSIANSDNIEDLLRSDWCDPVALDVLNPQLFPSGIILFNTRRSTNNVKVWRESFYEDVTNYTVGNFLSDAYEVANPGARAAAIAYLAEKPSRWVTFSGNDTLGVGIFGRQAQRICVVRAIAEQIVGNQDIRSEFINFNLIAAPGYVELLDELVTLNVDRRETSFIIADTPVDLGPNASNINAWATNSRNVAGNGNLGRTTLYDYAAMYYPWGLSTNVDGTAIVVPPSTIALRTYGFNDSVAYPWFPPAGTRRGVISNAESVGYVNEQQQYIPVTLNQGQRDTLSANKINPLTFVPGRGLLVYGDKTLSPNDGSALSRVNVARLVVYLRTILPSAVAPFLFELNTERTRNAAVAVIGGILTDLIGKDGIEDFIVVDATTPEEIDAGIIKLEVAIAPRKSVNFISIPIRLARTGSI